MLQGALAQRLAPREEAGNGPSPPLPSPPAAPGPWLAASSALADRFFLPLREAGLILGWGAQDCNGRAAAPPPCPRVDARCGKCRPKDRTAPGSPGSPTGWDLVRKPGLARGAHLAATIVRPLPCSPAEASGLRSAPPTAPSPPSPGGRGAAPRSSSRATLAQESRAARKSHPPANRAPGLLPRKAGEEASCFWSEAAVALGKRLLKPQVAQPLAAKRSPGPAGRKVARKSCSAPAPSGPSGRTCRARGAIAGAGRGRRAPPPSLGRGFQRGRSLTCHNRSGSLAEAKFAGLATARTFSGCDGDPGGAQAAAAAAAATSPGKTGRDPSA